MSFDGSFVLESALERFLSRNPNLRSVPELAAFSQKGGALTADEFVAMIADPFLHPKYTISILGCFPPLARKIVSRAVSKLQKVSNLESESNESEEEVGDGDIYVIDFYVRRGRGLRLHELASLAFCRALDLAPYLLSCILSYFRFSPPPFRRLLSIGYASTFIEKVALQLLEAIRVSYRFMLMNSNVFANLWDLSCFLDLVYWMADRNFNDALQSSHNFLDIRWCALQMLSFRISDRHAREDQDFGIRKDQAFACLLRWEEFCQDTSLEKAGWYFQDSEVENGVCHDDEVMHFSKYIGSFSNESKTNSNGFDSEKRNCGNNFSRNLKFSGDSFVMTATVKKSFEMVLMAVTQRWPVLLYGPAGAGKTTLINRLANISENQVLFIHMDEQMDSKTLVGSYICSERPGEFRWQPGSLSQAILNGFWVVFEDIDKAPNDVQSLILPLLEGSSSFSTGHGEVLSVAESFRVFSTMSTSKHESCHGIEGRFSFSALWRKVMVGTAGTVDLLEIVNKWYPDLEPFSSKLVDTFQRFNNLSTSQVGRTEAGGMVLSDTFNRISIRDLLKWCKRTAGLGLNISNPGSSAIACQKICQEAIDIFTAFIPTSSIPSLERRLSAMGEIARIWGASIPENLYPPSKPVIQSLKSDFQVGRVTLPCFQIIHAQQRKPFAGLRSSLHVLERIACSVKYNEPVLLVGETGTGKTTLVQNLAMRLGQPLTVMNLSQQSDAADLLGGFKPSDARSICLPLYHEFKTLFCRTVSGKENEAVLRHCEVYAMEKKWKKLLKACQKSVSFVLKHFGKNGDSCCGSKRKRPVCEKILNLWESFSLRLDNARKQIGSSAGMTFKFVEGAFITALRNGHWILLDEVNLAPPETLQRIIGVLDGEKGTLCLAERGDIDYVERHPQFRLFACMNPASDAGKRELPYSFRNRLTEYFVDDVLDDKDLTLFVDQYLDENHRCEMSKKVVRFYQEAKKKSEETLQDGAGQKPQFSLRSLARALEYTKKAEREFKNFPRAIYDGFCMFFLTLLDGPSAKSMKELIAKYLLDFVPSKDPFDAYFDEKKEYQDSFMKNYVVTTSVKEHLKNLARAAFIKRYPVLLQGPTSSGKTSLVRYLATSTGHKFVRINNHEHTDLQEYLGSYITDSQGKLQFQEGVLVKAVRNGYWIVLDELNLAPSDVLEALNRLLDDNRELFVPEIQETVSAHPEFMLFATQNPPMLYGGRKVLSRAFRNRFLEIHVDEIPNHELSDILTARCRIRRTDADKMVEVMKDLQARRRDSKAFAGKHGFITPRDLFRWANRYKISQSIEDLAKDGYFLLAERLRDESEKNVVLETLQKHLRVNLMIDDLYKRKTILMDGVPKCNEDIVWTKSMRRLYFLVERCYQMREPVLLVGDTGGGKTTVCQLLSAVKKVQLHILNCHQYTETSDFIGGFHPVHRSKLSEKFEHQIEGVKQSKVFLHVSQDFVLSTDISQASYTIKQLSEIEKNAASFPGITEQDLDAFVHLKLKLARLQQKWQSIFSWQNGPLVKAMLKGHFLLIDEISLADDSVLERLNSVLEPERKLSLAEMGGLELSEIESDPNFFIMATMNPGGDYGKKELSPALRNRFTEIWVSSVTNVDELRHITLERFAKSGLSQFADHIIKFWQWFNLLQTGRMLTVRDLLYWVKFIEVTKAFLGSECAFIHGAFLVLLDGLSLGTGLSKRDAEVLREDALSFILEELKESGNILIDSRLSKLENYGWGEATKLMHDISSNDDKTFGINPFYITKGQNVCKSEGFEFQAPTTCKNALRVFRAMQLPKPVLLEGSPGVGKTSLIIALAEYSGHEVVRINLSEQTDMMDLLGSDLPVEGENGMAFAWSDGILLQALKKGSWVLLDELNLAPQSVLEGLNAILDHRAEVYIPELNQTHKCPPSFRIFACQNPSSQGGGRKGLPKSFLNRFTKVYVDELSAEDYLFVCQSRYPSIPPTLLSKLILFNNRLYEDTMVFRKYGQEGSPWEFNLRDVIRSCQIIKGAPETSNIDSFLNMVYLQRMRTAADRKEVVKLYVEVFGVEPSIVQYPELHISPKKLIVGSASVERNHFRPQKIVNGQLHMLPGFHQALEAIVQCVQQQWLCILVGPYSSGKTSLIRLLAQLTGNALVELNLSSGTDVSELLGCFEQYSSFHIFRDVVSQVERYVDEYFAVLSWKDLINERKSVFTKWLAFLASTNYNSSMLVSTFAGSWNDGSPITLSPLLEIIELLKGDLENFKLPVSWSCNDLERALRTVLDLQQNMKIQQPSKFVWMAGDLIKAIECGDWVVLDNANLCNPTILDRINSLVEPDGSITVNECGLVDGKPVKLVAHSKFRMFLTMDPKHGEVSRAMRNRGLEIFMMQPNWFGGRGIHDSDSGEINDVRKFLILSGIPFNRLILAMSEAHIYAKNAGSHLGVYITLLELSRWVQLFQQLLMNGNQPRWSLQLSWEHTYLSSLGEAAGRDTVEQAKLFWLSDTEWYKSDEMLGLSLSLPGGWPSPHSIINFVCYSEEACIRKNSFYLEYLGSHYVAYKLSHLQSGTSPWDQLGNMRPSLLPINVVRGLLFPNAPGHQKLAKKFDVALVNKMLFFAANWTLEQETESDFLLYVQIFKWWKEIMSHCKMHVDTCGCMVQTANCDFFETFLKILGSERDHSIWRLIFKCRNEIMSHCKINVDARSKRLLSTELVKLDGSNGSLMKSKKLLCNAVRCVPLLRLTNQQWQDEEDYVNGGEVFKHSMSPILSSLRCLEIKVLEVIPESQTLVMTYSNLLEYHILFWKSYKSSHFEHLSIIWHWLKKEALRLRHRFPVEVENLTLKKIPNCSYNYTPPTLWVYGGHPFLPSSAEIYDKMQQLFAFCDEIWPNSHNSDDTFSLSANSKLGLSANYELRQIAMHAVCLLSCAITKGDQETEGILPQLEDIYQNLLIRVEHEKENLETISQFKEYSRSPAVGCSNTACCTSSLGILCMESVSDSWMVTLFDQRSLLLDINVLQVLSKCVLVDPEEAYQVLLNTSNSVQHNLDYSISYSSRSPVDFSPQQSILWILDAWGSVDSVNTKLASLLQEMWFRWHSSLWHCCSEIHKKFSLSGCNDSCHIMHMTRTTIIDKILEGTFSIMDYDMRCAKLRVVSRNLWQDVPLQGNIANALLSIADSRFKQIIFVHGKFFGEDAFEKIKWTLCQLKENSASKREIQSVKTLMSSSTHCILTSLVDPVIEALLEELYIKHQSCDFLYNLAFAWVHIGVLRFHLLLNPDGPDPAMKYAYKHSVITEKLSSLELEIKVRQDCERVAGRSPTEDSEQERVSLLQRLEEDRKRVSSKIVFRPEPSNYKNMRSACSDFGKLVSHCMELVEELRSSVDTPASIAKANNWQASSSSFIESLSKEYAGYRDLIQPVQVAIYEMKLGLSLAVSSAVERDYLRKVDEENSERVLATIYSLMQFPRELHPGFTPDYLKPTVIPGILHTSKSAQVIDINFLKKLATISSDISSDKALQAKVDHIILIGAAHHACSSHILDKALFLLLNEIFDHFVTLWMEMKSQVKAKEDGDACYYKFRSRSIMIEDVMGGQFSLLSMSDSDGSSTSECEELLVEQEFTEAPSAKDCKFVEEEWSLIPESILQSLVLVHNQLFGSSDLSECPGIFKISSEDRLHSFMDSYRLGASIIKDLQALSSSTLDDNLMPEHLLYICLEHEQTVGPISRPSHAYNIYKDSNATVIFKMVKPLSVVHEKVRSLLEDEHPGHPGLQKVFDITNTLLKIPLSTPLSKALLGLQLLVSRAESLQENFSISLTDHLHPIRTLVSSWQKLELDCWPVLLDEVQEQYTTNAGKLWFPLRAILHRNLSGGGEVDTIQSVEDFIQTSSVGEFMKRLHLLLAFHNQINHGVCLQVYSSSHMRENLNILYNAFGYYLQFIPVVLEHIQCGRNTIEKELKECLKLFNWEHTSIENFRRTRQKIWKLVKKFNDILQQPVMVILNQEAIQKREKDPSWLEEKICDENNIDVVQFPVDLVQLRTTERFLWFEEWKLKGDSTIKYILHTSASIVDLLRNKEGCMAVWMEGWDSLEKICRAAAEFAHLWKHGTKNLRKRRALGDLLKTLESCGLSRCKTMVAELAGHASGSFLEPSFDVFLQPSFDVVHLLQPEFCPSSKPTSIHLPGYSQKPADDKCTLTWKAANNFYFKNLGMVQQLREVRLNFKKELRLEREQVNRAVSFIDHLTIIQQEQRSVAYGVAEQLQKLRQQFHNLSRIETGDGCSLSSNQHVVLKCMWQQKNLFDNLLSMSKDVQLLLLSVKLSHQDNCDIVRAEADMVSVLIDKFIPIFLASKESLDMYLLGNGRVVMVSAKCMPFIVSQQMEELVILNFQVLCNFEEDIKTLLMHKDLRRSVEESLLNRFENLLFKGKMILADFNSEMEANRQSCFEEQSFMGMIDEIKKLLIEAFGKIDLVWKDRAILGELSAQNITKWKDLFGTYMANLHLDLMYDALSRTILSAGKLINCSATKNPEIISQIDMNLKHLHVSLDLFLTFGENLLSEFLDAHKTITQVTHALAQLFILLFSKGFGDPEEPSEDSTCNGSKDACGTGMGEGEGVKDVSEQIEDEDQLLGTSDKDGMDKTEIPSNKDKGVEMDEDFDADTFSVSEDSGDSDNENEEEDINLESKMGETGDDKQAVDEKPWNKDEDDGPDSSIEKYASGPSIKEIESGDKELRAKEDDAHFIDESAETENNEHDKQCDEDSKTIISDDENAINEMDLDKKNAFEDPTEIQLSDHEQDLEDVMEEALDAMQENDSGPIESDEEMRDDGEQSNLTDHIDDDERTIQADDKSESKNGADDANNRHVDMESSKENILPDKIEPSEYPAPTADSNNADFSMEPDMRMSNSSDMNNNVAPSRSSLFDEIPKMELSIPDAGENSKLASDQQPRPQVAQDSSPSVPKSQSNPYRSLGDAMKEWKERVKVSVDPQEAQHEGSDDFDKESADEYKYVSEVEKATSQALGSATTDQINGNVEGKEDNEDEGDIRKKEEMDLIDSVEENPETRHLRATHPLSPKEKVNEKVLDTVVDGDDLMEEMQPNTPENSTGDTVLFKNSYMNETVFPLNDTLNGGTDLLKPMNIEGLSDDARKKAMADWKRYELSTAKLSQELTEHLRLVMEPTIASKLQGDYRTGKRINMKKVIPYIASHYRKDKIWLRRTKPNKRDYQVVIAIDDSRSMSESHCGSAAVESLVTVCRAMSQLEVGQFAVASFGEKGKIKLLHDFDQTFTGESGVKMISSLSFKQDNTIADEPVVDLLKYMNIMLDAAVMKARLPSGQNPLHQLILIIADGRFHEKENLKRCIRNVLNRKRMIAFILLDSPKESIMDLMEASFEGGKLSFTKYLNSFPFPFYVLLKDMEALPRALADLLRQWFELMQSANE